MNRGVMESSPVQHLTADGNPNWWNNVVSGGLKPLPPFMSHQPPSSTTYLLPSLLPNFFPSPTSSSPSLPPLSSNPNLSSWLETTDLLLDQPWSLSQLLWGGVMMGEEERMEMMNHHHHQNQQYRSYQEKKLEIGQEQVLRNHTSMKQQSNNNNGYVRMSSPRSPPNKSCVTDTTRTTHNTNEDNNNGLNLTTEYKSSEIGVSSYANKKPKLQVTSSNSTLKVRKEKLGGRIAALHQLVSPFGKTDTASVLSEAIGYIRFLHSQIEALSLPYFGTPSRKNIMQQHALGDMNGIFPEDPGQLVNEYCMKISKRVSSTSCTDSIQESNNKEDGNKELRSRGLCLVPISYTLQIATDDNYGADYWAPPFGITFR